MEDYLPRTKKVHEHLIDVTELCTLKISMHQV